LLAVRFQTVVGWPQSRKTRAIADPIAPRPSTVTGVDAASDLVSMLMEADGRTSSRVEVKGIRVPRQEVSGHLAAILV